jgi:hypothetical protein
MPETTRSQHPTPPMQSERVALCEKGGVAKNGVFRDIGESAR